MMFSMMISSDILTSQSLKIAPDLVSGWRFSQDYSGDEVLLPKQTLFSTLWRSSTPYSYNGIKIMFDPTIEVMERQDFLNFQKF